MSFGFASTPEKLCGALGEGEDSHPAAQHKPVRHLWLLKRAHSHPVVCQLQLRFPPLPEEYQRWGFLGAGGN